MVGQLQDLREFFVFEVCLSMQIGWARKRDQCRVRTFREWARRGYGREFCRAFRWPPQRQGVCVTTSL